MKTGFRLFSFALGLMAACLALRAQLVPTVSKPASDPPPAPAGRVQHEITRLLREDAGLSSKADPGIPPIESPDEVLVLDPIVVTEKKTPVLPPALHETPVNAFIRTGTIAEHVGRKVTTRFWFSDALRLSFSW